MKASVSQISDSGSSDSRASYFGGKSGAGVYQTLINQIPPHDRLIVPFAGRCGVTRHLRLPEIVNLYDKDIDVVRWWQNRSLSNRDCLFRVDCRCGLSAIRGIEFRATCPTFIYCDPPYPLETRKSGPRYRYEFSERDHTVLLQLLTALNVLPSDRRPMMMVSSYWSEQYAKALSDWRHFSFRAQTRRGVATEHVWCNYDEPHQLQDYRYLGRNKRERFKLERRRRNLIGKLTRMPELERNALLSAMMDEFRKGKEST